MTSGTRTSVRVVERDWLARRLEAGRSIESIARECGRHPSTVEQIVRRCRSHGWTTYRPAGEGQYRCVLCGREAVAERRRRVKQLLVAEAGGRCVVCGYDRYVGALHFHHLDAGGKAFEINGKGTTRSLSSLRAEARKCTLLCANCHAEVEAGATALPYHVGEPAAGTDGPG
jgi:DNA-directed RNA polymerase subunit RPC12/RpoP